MTTETGFRGAGGVSYEVSTGEELRAWMNAHGYEAKVSGRPDAVNTKLLGEDIRVPDRTIRTWLSGRSPVPTWLPVALRGAPRRGRKR